MYAVVTMPPEPPLILIPAKRVCNCGRLMSRRERITGACDVCVATAAMPNVIPFVPFAPGVA